MDEQEGLRKLRDIARLNRESGTSHRSRTLRLAAERAARRSAAGDTGAPKKLANFLFACRLMWEETQDPTALIEALGWLRPRLPSWMEIALVRVLEASRYNDKGEPRRVTTRHDDRERHAVRWMYSKHFKKPDVSWDKAWARAAEELQGHWAEADFETVKKSYAMVQRDLEEGRISIYQIWRNRHLG